VVYKVVEQKVEDSNITANMNKDIENIKNSELLSNLLQKLSKKYKIESYTKGL
jgi:hypothetical protein